MNGMPGTMNVVNRWSYSKYGNAIATSTLTGGINNSGPTTTTAGDVGASADLLDNTTTTIPIIVSFRHPQQGVIMNSNNSTTSSQDFHVRNIISKKNCHVKIPIFCRYIVEHFASNQWLYSICRHIYSQEENDGDDGKQEDYNPHIPLNIKLDFGHGCFTTILLRRHDSSTSSTSSTLSTSSKLSSPRKLQLSMTLNIKTKEDPTSSYIMSPFDTIWDQLSTTPMSSSSSSLLFNPHFEVVPMNRNHQFIGISLLNDNEKKEQEPDEEEEEEQQEEEEGDAVDNDRNHHFILLTIKDNGKVGIARRLKHEKDFDSSNSSTCTRSTTMTCQLNNGKESQTTNTNRLKRRAQNVNVSSDTARKPSARKKQRTENI